MTDTPVTLPSAAQERIRAFQVEIRSLQAQLQQFVDGVLVGMGVDLSGDIQVDPTAMTVTIVHREDDDD